jgi:hypothetical protein
LVAHCFTEATPCVMKVKLKKMRRLNKPDLAESILGGPTIPGRRP